MISPTNYLDFYNLFFNEIIGDVTLGVIIGLVLVLIQSVKKNMAFQLTLFFMVLFLCVIMIVNPSKIIRLFVIFIVGFTFYYGLAKALGRGA